MAETILMAVHSPARGGGHKGVFAGGLFWRQGTSVQEVALDRVRDVQAKQQANMLKILAVGKDDVEKALAAEAKATKEVAAAEAEAARRINDAKARLPPGVGPRGSASQLPGTSSTPHSHGPSDAEIDRVRREFDSRDQALNAKAKDLEAREAELAKLAAELKSAPTSIAPPAPTAPSGGDAKKK